MIVYCYKSYVINSIIQYDIITYKMIIMNYIIILIYKYIYICGYIYIYILDHITYNTQVKHIESNMI